MAVSVNTNTNALNVVLAGSQGVAGARGDLPQTPVDITCVPSITIDSSQSAVYRILADQSFTLEAPTNGVDGQRIIIEVQQDGTGSHPMTVGAGLNAGPVSVVLSSDPDAIDLLGLMYRESTTEWLIISFARGY